MKRQHEQLTLQVQRDLDAFLERESADDDLGKLRLLLSLSQGVRTLFDQKLIASFDRFSIALRIFISPRFCWKTALPRM